MGPPDKGLTRKTTNYTTKQFEATKESTEFNPKNARGF